MTHRRASIASIVITMLVAVTTVLLGTFVIMSHRIESDRQWAELRAELKGEADQLATGIALPIWNIDRDQIDKVVESAFKNHNVFGVRVAAAGRIHARYRDAQWRVVATSDTMSAPDLLREDRPVIFSGDTVGTVRIYSTPQFVEENLRRSLVSTFVAIVVLDIILTVSLYLLLRLVVLKPLKKVEQYAASVSSGNATSDAVDALRFRGELEGLRLSISKMVNLLEIRYHQLQESVQQFHLLAQRLEGIREEERRAISHEVHDELGQILTALRMDLMSFKQMKVVDSSDVAKKVQSMLDLSASAIKSVQDVSARLRPGMLDDLGLVAAMEWQVEDFQKRSGIVCKVNLPEQEPTLDNQRSTAIFRILQETLTNIARHAHATKVSVILSESENHVSLFVEDDGVGIPDTKIEDPKSYGLLGIRERLRPYNGTFVIRKSEKGGTEAMIRIPKQPSVTT